MDRGLYTSAAVPALALCLALPQSALAGRLYLDSTGLVCPDRPAIERQVRVGLGAWLENQPDITVVVDSRPPSQLVVQLKALGEITERVVSLSAADCPQVPATVTLLVRSWLNRRWDDPPAVRDDDILRAAASPPAVATTPAVLPAPRSLALIATAGAFLQPWDGRRASLFAFAGDWAPTPRWGIDLNAQYEAAVSQRLGRGTASVAVWRIAPLARLRALEIGGAQLELLAGPALCVLQESGEGYMTDFNRRFVDAGLLASARWRQELWGPVSAVFGLEAQLRFGRESVHVRNVEATLALPRGRVSVFAGFAWKPF
jgi:hypothetical protein